MEQLETLAANLSHAARTQKPAHIGGGEFSPAECAELAALIRSAIPPNPGACYSARLAGFDIVLTQQSRARFTVRYGAQTVAGLTYAKAAAELGAAIMHAAACESKLEN